MNLWLVRAGADGEYEEKFAADSRIYLTWDGLDSDLRELPDRQALVHLLATLYPDDGLGRRRNHASQIWPFVHSMNAGDWIVLPRKTDRTIWIGEVVGRYEFHQKGPDPFHHSRSIKWIKMGLPRERFGQDLLHSFGAFMTVCRIERNNAMGRVRAMAANGWKTETTLSIVSSRTSDSNQSQDEDSVGLSEPASDLEAAGLDQIARLGKVCTTSAAAQVDT